MSVIQYRIFVYVYWQYCAVENTTVRAIATYKCYILQIKDGHIRCCAEWDTNSHKSYKKNPNMPIIGRSTAVMTNYVLELIQGANPVIVSSHALKCAHMATPITFPSAHIITDHPNTLSVGLHKAPSGCGIRWVCGAVGVQDNS